MRSPSGKEHMWATAEKQNLLRAQIAPERMQCFPFFGILVMLSHLNFLNPVKLLMTTQETVIDHMKPLSASETPRTSPKTTQTDFSWWKCTATRNQGDSWSSCDLQLVIARLCCIHTIPDTSSLPLISINAPHNFGTMLLFFWKCENMGRLVVQSKPGTFFFWRSFHKLPQRWENLYLVTSITLKDKLSIPFFKINEIFHN